MSAEQIPFPHELLGLCNLDREIVMSLLDGLSVWETRSATGANASRVYKTRLAAAEMLDPISPAAQRLRGPVVGERNTADIDLVKIWSTPSRIDKHSHVATIDENGNGTTTAGPDGHTHTVAWLEFSPGRDGHTHDISRRAED